MNLAGWTFVCPKIFSKNHLNVPALLTFFNLVEPYRFHDNNDKEQPIRKLEMCLMNGPHQHLFQLHWCIWMSLLALPLLISQSHRNFTTTMTKDNQLKSLHFMASASWLCQSQNFLFSLSFLWPKPTYFQSWLTFYLDSLERHYP